MIRRHIGMLMAAGGLALASAPLAHAADVFTLASSSFKDGAMLAVTHAGNLKTNPNCVGQNVSPPLAWSHPPEGTKSYALIMVDPEGRNGLGVIHWLAYNIAASVTGFDEGETSQPSPKYTGGKGSAGQQIYMGPCPPPGHDAHHYTFTLVATDLEPGALPAGLTYPELMDKLNGHARQAAGIIGLFKKP